MTESEKITLICPKCGEHSEVLWFPSKKFKVTIPGSRAGSTTKWTGNEERIEGTCKCGYKFKPTDLDE